MENTFSKENTLLMKILITGGSGLLGQALMACFQDQDVYGTYYQHPSPNAHMMFLDITSKKNVDKVINIIGPDIIVHTAALTGVDYCENHQSEAALLNVSGTKNFMMSSKKMKAKFVYISTDYVFNGEKGRYTEQDPTDPINVYGETKLAGEKLVEQGCREYIIARTSVLYGSPKGNFATWIISQLSQGKPISVVEDQYVTPTNRYDLAEQLRALIEKDEDGVFHTAGAERINRYEFAVKIAEIFGFDANLITSLTMDNMKWIAKRPRDSSLDTTKIASFKKPYKINHALSQFKAEYARDHST